MHVIDGESFTKVGFIPTGVGAHGLYPSRDGKLLYVANRGSHEIHGKRNGNGSVSVIDFASEKVVATWGIPGGARDSHENPAEGALREACEETGIPSSAVRVGGELVDDHGGWSYTTVLAELLAPVRLVRQEESAELRWVPVSAVTALDLHPGFAGTWPALRERLG